MDVRMRSRGPGHTSRISSLSMVLLAAAAGCDDPDATADSEPSSESADVEESSGTDAPGSTTSEGGEASLDAAKTGATGETSLACAIAPWPPAFGWFDADYLTFQLCGFDVAMRLSVVYQHGEQVYNALAQDLQMVAAVLPPAAVSYLQTVNIWVESNVPGIPGAVYHPGAQWLIDHGFPAYWAQGVQIANTTNYLDWRAAIQPAMVLHELAHAWDHQVHGFANPGVVAAYNAAVASGSYNNVPYILGGTQPAYALNNNFEYFAELTEARFWVNDFYPYNHPQLMYFDPAGYAAVDAAWSATP